MKNLFYILSSILIVLSSCTKVDNNTGIPGPDLFIEISVFNKANVDLLNPANPESFDHDGIGYFYIENGQAITMYNGETLGDGTPKYDNPKGFSIYESDNSYVIDLKSHRTSTGYAEYLLKWDNENSDTIKCKYIVDNSIGRISKIWHNQTVVWELSDGTGVDGRSFKIIRQ